MTKMYDYLWDFIKKELDNDIIEAFEGDGVERPLYYLKDPFLTAVNLQLTREIKKQNNKNNEYS